MSKDAAESTEMKEALGLNDQDFKPTPTKNDEPATKPIVEKKKESPEPKPAVTPKPDPVKKEAKKEDEELELPEDLFATSTKKESTDPEPAPEPAADDEIKSLKLSDKQHRAFVAMREELKQAKAEAQKARSVIPAQTVEVKENPEHLATIESLKTQLTEAYDKLGQLSLDADPRFNARFNTPQQTIVADIKGILKDFEHDEAMVDKLITLNRKQRIQMLNDEAPDTVAAVTPLLMQFDHLQRERDEALKNHKAMRDVLATEQQKQSSMINQQAKGMLFKKSLEHVMADGTFILKPVEGNNPWNAGVAKVQEKVKYLFTADDPEEQTRALILGAAAPIYLEMLKKEHSRRIELERQMKLRQGNRPSLDGRAPTNREPAKMPTEMSPDEAASRAMGE